MNLEHSCGAILYTIENGVRKYVLIMEANGNYGFPKGHIDNGETDLECALREIKEETGIIATILPNIKRTIKYPIPNKCFKEVVYFVAKYENQELNPEDENILGAKKYDLDVALSLIKFSQLKGILLEIDLMLDLKGE